MAGVSLPVTRPIVIEAMPGLPANNLKKLIELAKKQPGKLTDASPGSGRSTYLAGELRKANAGIDRPHAPYKGLGPAYPDVFAGRMTLMMDPRCSSLPHIKGGHMKPLAVINLQRTPR